MSIKSPIFLTQITGVLFALMISSCTPSKKVVYLNDLTIADTAALRIVQNSFEVPIQKNDQLWITVGGSNPADLLALNSGNGTGGGGGSSVATASNVAFGYLVEADGKIQIPFLGKVQAEGLTRVQLENQLTNLFKDYTKNPVVNVRYLNYTFSVLGEVGRPGKFNMSSERTSILEALSIAGDITYLGKSNNVLVIREVNGQRTIGRLSMLSKDLFKSPFYFLKTNDVIYVEPVKAKFISRAGVPQYLAIATLGLTLIFTIATLRK